MSTKAYGRPWRWEPLVPTAKVVVGLLAACGAIALIQVVLVGNAMSHVAGLTVPVAQLAPQLQNQGGLFNGVNSLVTLGAGVSWLIWQHKAQADLYARGLPGLRYSPGWAVGWWFVPFANFVMPYLTMRELWDNVGRAGGSPSRDPRGWRVFAWWLVYMASALVAVIGFGSVYGSILHSVIERSNVNSPSSTISITLSTASIHAARLGLIWADALRAVAAALAMSVVLTISRREDAVGSALPALAPPTTPGLVQTMPPRPDLG